MYPFHHTLRSTFLHLKPSSKHLYKIWTQTTKNSNFIGTGIVSSNFSYSLRFTQIDTLHAQLCSIIFLLQKHPDTFHSNNVSVFTNLNCSLLDDSPDPSSFINTYLLHTRKLNCSLQFHNCLPSHHDFHYSARLADIAASSHFIAPCVDTFITLHNNQKIPVVSFLFD
jgi:hypothetical protein